MVFSVRSNQLFYTGSFVLSGYLCLKRSLSAGNHLCTSFFGSQPLNKKIEKYTIDFFSKGGSLKELVLGTDNQKKRIFNLKRGVKSSLEALFWGFVTCLCIKASSLPPQENALQDALTNGEDLEQTIDKLLQEVRPYIRKSEINTCYNEAMQWHVVPQLRKCLDLSSVNPPRFQYLRAELLDPKAHDPTLNCSNLMTLIGGISFYKVDLFRYQLETIEIQFKRLLSLFKSSVAKAREEFEAFLSSKYLGDWKQLWIGRIVAINYRVLCNPAAYELFNNLENDCSLYQNPIIDNLNKIEKLQGSIPFTSGTRIDCSSILAFDFSILNASNFSLPLNFTSLIKENKFQEVADFFVSHGGTRPIKDLEFNFSSIPSKSHCKYGEEDFNEIYDENVLFQRSFRSTGRSLNSKFKYLSTQEDFNFTGSNKTVSQWLNKIKGVLVA